MSLILLKIHNSDFEICSFSSNLGAANQKTVVLKWNGTKQFVSNARGQIVMKYESYKAALF